MLVKGDACLQCRKQKNKCDGLKPQCSRCNRFGRDCIYSPLPRRRTQTGALEARTMELELIAHKLTISATHDLFSLSKKLQERIRRFGTPPKLNELPHGPTPSWQLTTLSEWRRRSEKVLAEDVVLENLSAIQTVAEEELHSLDLSNLEHLPFSLSIRLINLFLPFRYHYFFLTNISHFTCCLPLPPSDPDSIHPCLLNACYLAACACNRGGLSAFIPHFLDRTRHFLQQSLMFADRITQFLWANIILGAFFGKERRILEAVTAAGALTRFTLACGLGLPGDSITGTKGSSTIESLLPPPKDQAESDDRVRFAHALYAAGQGLPHLGQPAAWPFEDWWSPISQEASFKNQDNITIPKEKYWRLEVYLSVLVTNTFERVKTFAQSVVANGHLGREEEYLSIETQIRVQHESFRPLYDPHRYQTLQASSMFDVNVVVGYATLYGSGLVLHSLWANHTPESRAKMLECLQGLVDICTHTRNCKRPHLGLMSAVHIINAVRLIAHELVRSKVKGNTSLSVSYCLTIESLLDFLDDTMLFFPAWVDVLLPLKDTLTAAATSLCS
ncbi:hypothetical protein DL93DRAFT_1797617 [Clavulina sp. PMI_390]|nr:hypothetical protein DL93DRAFT_1797617 [Clavulina sp. PMI_390]